MLVFPRVWLLVLSNELIKREKLLWSLPATLEVDGILLVTFGVQVNVRPGVLGCLKYAVVLIFFIGAFLVIMDLEKELIVGSSSSNVSSSPGFNFLNFLVGFCLRIIFTKCSCSGDSEKYLIVLSKHSVLTCAMFSIHILSW